MSRGRILALAAAIVVFAGGAVVLVRILEGGPGATGGPSAEPTPSPVATPPAAPAGAALTTPAAATTAAPEQPPPDPPGPPAWESILAVHRPSELGRELAAPVSDGLDEASNRMDHCYQDEQRRMARAKPPPDAPAGPAILVLRLEGAPGRLVVVGTEIETTGHSSRAFAECCEKAIQGYELPVPAAKPGMRIRYKLLLQ